MGAHLSTKRFSRDFGDGVVLILDATADADSGECDIVVVRFDTPPMRTRATVERILEFYQ